jgi:hypothetical protein
VQPLSIAALTNDVSEKMKVPETKKAIPGMERPLTIACHMKILILGLKHYPASWDILSSHCPSS